jgi:hypothetical protein
LLELLPDVTRISHLPRRLPVPMIRDVVGPSTFTIAIQ